MPCGSSTSLNGLRSLAHVLITDRRLPVVPSTAVNAGYGTGNVCRLRDQPIERHQVEYQVCTSPLGPLLFHLTCHAAWQLECQAHLWTGATGIAQEPAGGRP